MRAAVLALWVVGCVVEPGAEAVPEHGCATAADCAFDEFCALDEAGGACRALPDACGAVGDCADPTCADALEATCADGLEAVRCNNPIDDDSTVIGNPAFTCG